MFLLSVIIPIFNAAPWLEQCMQSILRAAKGREEYLEVILVDDGSTDQSPELMERYSQQYGIFRAVHQENSGVAAARNTGLSLATGSYIAWVDADDYVSEAWLLEICQAVEKSAPDIIVMDSIRFDGHISTPEVYGRAPGRVRSDLFYADAVRDIRMLGGLPNKVIRRELYQGIHFDPSLPILEDYAVILDIIGQAQSVVYIPQGLYYYRQRASSLLHQVDPDRAFFSIEMALRRMENVPRRFHRAAVCAVLGQILAFYHHQKTVEGFCAEARQLDFCRKFIRSHLGTALLDSELPLWTKVKLAYLALSPKL